MPELPEVETYVRELEPALNGATVTGGTVNWARTIAAPSVDEFLMQIKGQRFTSFNRRGKYMLLGMERDGNASDTLIIHLRMTGEVHIYSPEESAEKKDKHTHVILTLDDGRHLHYRDQRKFGRLWLVDDPAQVLFKLGPEPLSDDFTIAGFEASLVRRGAAIKGLLLDQSIVAGVGNIYADEALFLAQIHPLQGGNSLTIDDLERLREAVRVVLKRGIELKGSTLQNYLRLNGTKGNFQEEHKVFRRTGLPCPTCGTPIERIVVTQRSTHFCPTCQVEKKQKKSKR